jgi:hypothetical protein
MLIKFQYLLLSLVVGVAISVCFFKIDCWDPQQKEKNIKREVVNINHSVLGYPVARKLTFTGELVPLRRSGIFKRLKPWIIKYSMQNPKGHPFVVKTSKRKEVAL